MVSLHNLNIGGTKFFLITSVRWPDGDYSLLVFPLRNCFFVLFGSGGWTYATKPLFAYDQQANQATIS